MGLSETIVAAMIGAAATIMAATVQFLMAIRGKSKAETRPKRSATRSLVTLGVIVLASAVGGFAYSELRAERVREDTRQLREALSTQLQELATSTARLEHLRTEQTSAAAAEPVALINTPTSEAILRLHPCRAEPVSVGFETPACDEATAERVSLCAAVPVQAKVSGVELFAKTDEDLQPWEQSRAEFNHDIDGTRFADAPYDQMQGADHRSVCVNLAHWNSAHGHVARLVVHYASGAAPAGSQATLARSQ
jgi:hypothetical protein